jgi:glycosyltransferase involved in cell wall biosynthesis
MCRALSRLGVDVELVSTNQGEAGTWAPFQAETKLEVALGVPVAWQGVTARFFDVMPPTRLAMARGLANWLRSEVSVSDLVHIHCLHHYPGMVAAGIAARHGVPYLVSPHGELAPYHRRRKRLRKLLFYRLFESKILDRAAAVHYTSRRELDGAASVRIRAPAVIVPAGVDLPELEPEALRGQFRAMHPETGSRLIVTFLGRLAHQKGLDLLIPAFAKVVERFPDCHLVVAGPIEDAYGRAVAGSVRTWQIEGHVTMPGFVGGREKASLLADTDVWVLPSREENFGIAIVEAMAYGLPVVVSDNVGIHTEITAANAGVVVRLEVAELVEALSKLVSDANLRRKYATNAMALVRERFTWDNTARQMLRTYESIHNDSAALHEGNRRPT